MRNLHKKYGSFFRVRFLHALQYRTAAYAGIATQFAWGAMEMLMFAAFYRADPTAFPMDFSQLASYIWMQQSFLALFVVWALDTNVIQSITHGDIAYELIRPMSLYGMWFVKDMANRLAKVALRFLPILVVAAFLPEPYGIKLPPSPGMFVLFLVSMLLAFFNVLSFCMLIYLATFFTMSPLGVRMMAIALTDLLAGMVVPIPFFPDGVRQVVELLPFASMQNAPFLIYSGSLTGDALTRTLALQVFWVLVMMGGGMLLMQRALRRAVVQGG